MHKKIQELAVLYLIIWSIAPPLGVDMRYRLIAVACAVVWALIAIWRGFKIEKVHIWAAFFMMAVMLIAYIESSSMEHLFQQIALYILVVCFVIEVFYRQGRWTELGEIVPILLILLIIFNWNTTQALIEDPTIARRIVRADEATYEYLRRGVGGYGLIYPQVCISPALLAWTIKAYRNHKIYFTIGCVWVFTYVFCIAKAGYSIAIFASIVGVVMLFFYNGKSIWKALFISGTIFAAALLAILYLDGFRNFLLQVFDGTAVAKKINDLVATSISKAPEGSIQSRIEAYEASLGVILDYPLVGGMWKRSGGGHSAVMDMFAKYGVWGGYMYARMIFHVPNVYKKSVNNPDITKLSNAVLVVMVYVTMLNSATYSFMCTILLVLPLLYEDILKWDGEEVVRTVRSPYQGNIARKLWKDNDEEYISRYKQEMLSLLRNRLRSVMILVRKVIRRGKSVVVDIHSHILAGIDDGAKNLKETIKMIDIAIEEGIDAIIATPHYEIGIEPEVLTKYQEVYDSVLQYIESQEIPLQLYQGNEIYYSESIPELLQKGDIHTMNGTRYILVEFSPVVEFSSMERALSKLLYAGYWPILAHTERYMALRKIDRVEELIRMGAYIQLNTSAIIGKEGWQTKRYCHQLLKKRLVHAIGTDAHSSHHRRPQMVECLAWLDKKYGTSYRKEISEDNPQSILKGEKISGKN